MLHLYLVRHGQTDSNKEARHLGFTDLHLNEEGKRQAEGLKEYFKDIPLEGVYASDLSRTMDTARAFVKEVVPLEGLRERNFGWFEDLTFAEIVERYPEEQKAWEQNWIDYEIPKGESARQSYARQVSALEGIIQKHPAGHVAVVTHLGVIRFLLAHLLALEIEDSWHFRVDNATVTCLQIDEGYSVLHLLGYKI